MRERSGWEIVRALLGFGPKDTPTQEELERPPTYTPGGLNLEQHYPASGEPKPEDDPA
jgi:hypothetical protein